MMRNRDTVVLALAAAAAIATTPHASAQEIVIDDDFHTAALITADINADGLLDIVAASYYGDVITWWENRGQHDWQRHDVSPLNGATSLQAVDIDNDGDPDLLGISRVEGQLLWFENDADEENDGQRTFQAHTILTRENAAPSSITAADIDGDGDNDVVVSFTYDPNILILRNVDGAGDSLGLQIETITVPGNGVSLVHLEDFDDDGDVDLIAATPWDWIEQDNYFWYRNDDTGQFGPRRVIAGGLELQDAFSAAVADVNGDGLKDLVTMSGTNQMNNSVNWFQRMNQAGTLWSERQVIDDDFFGGSESHCLTVADVNNDGHIDIVAGSTFIEPRIRVWINKNAGERFCAHTFHDGFSASAVAAADLNGDGDTEIVAGSWSFYTGKIRYFNAPLESCHECESDLNLDNTVDVHDLLELFANWGDTGDNDADIDGDGTVDQNDLQVLLAAWGSC